MIRGTTSTGFNFEVNEGIRTDWRFVRALSDIESGDDTKVLVGTTTLVELLVGVDGEKRLCDHIKTDDGLIPLKALMTEIAEIIKALRGDVKNS